MNEHRDSSASDVAPPELDEILAAAEMMPELGCLLLEYRPGYQNRLPDHQDVRTRPTAGFDLVRRVFAQMMPRLRWL